MKKNKHTYTGSILALLLVLVFSVSATAQKKFSEGSIHYDITISSNSSKPQNADFLDGATSVVYIKGQRSRTEMISALGTQSTIVDANNAAAILKEYGDQKYMIRLTPAEWREANKKNFEIVYSYDASETRTIHGYICKKAVGKFADGTTFTAWFTTDLIPENKDFDPVTSTLPGLAMEYETSLGDVRVKYAVSKIDLTQVPASKFDLPKAGFRVLTYSESKGL